MKQNDKQRKWTSRSIGSRFQHHVFYVLIKWGGRRCAYMLLYVVVFYYIFFRPSLRKKTSYYISRRFPQRKPLRKFLDSYRMGLELGKVLVDRAILGILGLEQMKVTLHGRERLLELLNEGHGLILMLSHVGCWQVALSCLGFLNTPVNVLMHKEEGDVDKHYYEHKGMPNPYRIIDPDGYLGGVLDMIDILKKREALCVMGDRVLGSEKNTVTLDFLGGKCRFPFSIFKIASETNAPVAIVFSYKTGPASYEIELATVVRVPGGLGRTGEHYSEHVAQFVRALESYTLKHPYQFFNFYDMWEPEDEHKTSL